MEILIEELLGEDFEGVDRIRNRDLEWDLYGIFRLIYER